MSAPVSHFVPGLSTQVRRKDRAETDPGFVEAVIDEALICHVAFAPAAEGSQPPVARCLPMAHARIGERIYLHGAQANGALRALVAKRCSLTFTLLDGLVFARSAFHHSMNYRCVVVVGTGRLVTDLAEKRAALRALVNHAAAGRADECVDITNSELKATLVLAVEVEEASGKARRGPPVDDAEHVAENQHFAGVVPIAVTASAVERASPALAVPASLNQRVTQLGGDAVIEEEQHGVLYSSDPGRLNWPWLHQYLSVESYWAAGVTEHELKTSLRHSLVFGAYCCGQQVAFARVLSDRSRIGYLADVFVDAGYRGRGYGKQIADFALRHPAVRACGRVLLGTRDAHGLYEKLGFVATSNRAMVRTRESPTD